MGRPGLGNILLAGSGRKKTSWLGAPARHVGGVAGVLILMNCHAPFEGSRKREPLAATFSPLPLTACAGHHLIVCWGPARKPRRIAFFQARHDKGTPGWHISPQEKAAKHAMSSPDIARKASPSLISDGAHRRRPFACCSISTQCHGITSSPRRPSPAAQSLRRKPYCRTSERSRELVLRPGRPDLSTVDEVTHAEGTPAVVVAAFPKRNSRRARAA